MVLPVVMIEIRYIAEGDDYLLVKGGGVILLPCACDMP